MYPREFGCGVFLGCPRCVLTRWYHHAVQTCLCTQPVNLSWHHNEWLLLLTTQECGRVLLRYFSKTFFVKVLFQCCTRGTSTKKPLLWLCSVALFLCGPVPPACDSSASTQTHTHTSQITAVDTRRIYGLAVSQPLHVQFITFRP